MSKSRLLALSVLLVAVSPLAAQEKFPPTRIALINIGEVFNKSIKAKERKKEMEAKTLVYRKQMESLKTECNKYQQVLVDVNAEAEERAVAGKHLLALRRKMEDIDVEVRRVLGKKQEQFMLELFKEIQDAIKEHADANDIDLVLIYGDPPKDDVLKVANINRKMMAAEQGGLVPIFIRSRIDITQAVLERINDIDAIED
jgi:Skp family chaperone for outer membrane proteins